MRCKYTLDIFGTCLPARKKCTCCKQSLDIDCFTRSKALSDGLSIYCRKCKSLQQKAYSKSRADYIRSRAKGRKRTRVRDDKTRASDRLRKERMQIACPEVLRAKYHKYYATKRKNGGSFTAEEWKALCFQYGYKCLKCGQSVELTVDHVVPVSKGGTNDISNIQPLCLSCNSSKGAKTVDYRY